MYIIFIFYSVMSQIMNTFKVFSGILLTAAEAMQSIISNFREPFALHARNRYINWVKRSKTSYFTLLWERENLIYLMVFL